MTLSDAVDTWINARLNLAPSTVAGYRSLHRLYIVPAPSGAIDLADLTGADCAALLRPLLACGHTRQAKLLQVLVSAVLSASVRKGQLPRSVMDDVDRVQHRSRPTAWLTPTQARALLTSSAEAKDPYYIAWLLMLCCGLRRGEMLALRWSDIDEARSLLHIQRQEITVNRRVLTTRPKSLSSVRDIPLDEDLIALLRILRDPASGDNLLPADTSAWKLAVALDRALTRANLPRVTLHGLRHSMASVAAGDGVPVKVLQSLMGHAHYQTTADIYAHVYQQPLADAAHTIVHALIPARLEIA